MTGERYVITTHAISRFIERVRPGLAWSSAELELERILMHGELSGTPPAWLAETRANASMWVTLGDVALPVAPSQERVGRWVLLTCMTSGSISPAVRVHRNRLRSERTRSRRNAAGPGSRRSGTVHLRGERERIAVTG
jgi:hypothetical protein